MDHPREGLRYVDADDLDNSTVDFDGMSVESQTGDKLGEVDGFIIDINSAQPFYIVVNAGGWFTSKYFLLPIGHAGLESVNKKLITDISKDHVKKFPGFDRDEFEKLTEIELGRMDRQMLAACCPDETIMDEGFDQRYQTWKHYQAATWWDSSFYRPDRVDRTAKTMASTAPMASTLDQREAVVARSDDDDDRAGDVSPHLGGRAQPGDVLGIETGGEQTHVGETTDDENERRRDADKTAARSSPADRR